MLKKIVLLTVVCLSSWLVPAQELTKLRSLVVPQADMVLVAQGSALNNRPMVQKAFKLQEDWNQFCRQHGLGMESTLKELEALGLSPKSNELKTMIGSLAFNCADPDMPDMSRMEIVLGATYTKPIGIGSFKDVLTGLLHRQLKVAENPVTVKDVKGQGYEGMLIAIKMPAGNELIPIPLQRTILAVVDKTTVIWGTDSAVKAAIMRWQSGKSVPLDPFLQSHLRGDMTMAMRMLPILRTLILSFQDSKMPFIGELSKGSGFVFSSSIQEQVDLELAYYCAKPAEALAFKKQLWDPQMAMIVAMVAGSIKAQSDYKITCIDKLVCVADGNRICLRMPFTLADLEGYYYLQKKNILEAEKLMKQAEKKPAPKSKAVKGVTK